ncbi:MAG: hypothetical protein JRN58_10290 [Nitrososphaerota archaeon]|nr:hypothetical protein [Nitrososphaerota archaeon]
MDYGIIEQFHDSLTLPNGLENSEYAEVVAIRNADEACRRKQIQEGFVIYSDNDGAIKRSHLSYVQHIPKEKFHFADEYLYRMMSRASYLRRSAGKVKHRRPVSPIHDEITKLMKAERIEFHLSESSLFRAFKLEANPVVIGDKP